MVKERVVKRADIIKIGSCSERQKRARKSSERCVVFVVAKPLNFTFLQNQNLGPHVTVELA